MVNLIRLFLTLTLLWLPLGRAAPALAQYELPQPTPAAPIDDYYPSGRQVVIVGMGMIFGVMALNFAMLSLEPAFPQVAQYATNLQTGGRWLGDYLSGAFRWMAGGWRPTAGIAGSAAATTAPAASVAAPAAVGAAGAGMAAGTAAVAPGAAGAAGAGAVGAAPGLIRTFTVPMVDFANTVGLIGGIIGGMLAHYGYELVRYLSLE